eukprot:m.32016 g.32016  ORF g.32016 m.32016 type:complete len:716 (+) comp4852_c0_seq1:113-2260(+)
MTDWLNGSVSTLLTNLEEGLNSVDNLAAEKLQNRSSGLISRAGDLDDVDSGVALGIESRRRRVQRAGKERAPVSSDVAASDRAGSGGGGGAATETPSPDDAVTEQASTVPSDQLFDFANGGTARTGGGGERRPSASAGTRDDAPMFMSTPKARMDGGKEGPASKGEVPAGNGVAKTAEGVPDDPTTLKLRFTQLDDENRLLRREVAALTDEVSSFTTRMRSTQAALQDTRERLAAAERRVTKARAAQRDEQQRVQKLEAQIDAHDAETKALEDRILIAEQQVTDLKAEKEIILKDHTDSSTAHDGALTALRNELEALKSSRAATQGSLEASKSATEEQLEAARAEKLKLDQKLSEAIADASAKAAALKDATARTAALQQQHANLQGEFNEYKAKATQVLQKKEREIDALRAGGAGMPAGGDGSGGANNDATIQTLLEEKEALRQELGEAQGLIEQLRTDIRDLEQQQEEDAEQASSQIRDLEKALLTAETSRENTEETLARQLKEKSDALEEAERQRELLSQEAQRGASELQMLQSEVARLTQTTEGRATVELEEKLRALTGNVVRKQAQIEALSQEKTSLALQVEEMERQKRYETRINIPPRKARRDDELSGDGGRVRTLKSIFGEASGGKLHETVGTAVHTLDAASIRIGQFLRRYPAARLMVILYMILLHFWVMVVMLTYTPEMHTGLENGLHDHHPVAPDHVQKITFGRGH